MDISDDWGLDFVNNEIDHTAGHAITSVTNANPAVVTMTAHGYTAGDKIFITGVTGMTELNNKWWLVGTVGGANTFNLNDMNDTALDASGYSAGTGGAAAKKWSVRDVYSYFMDLMDDADNMDDPIPMKYDTPTEYQILEPWTFADEADATKFLQGGAITLKDSVNGDDIWANIYSVGSPLANDTDIYILQDGSVVTSFWETNHFDILLKVQNNGTPIDSGNLVVFARELGDRYTFFDVAAPSGRQVAAIATENDINDNEGGGSVVGVTLSYAGGYTDDFASGGTYDYKIDCGGNTLADTYEYLKYITRRGSTFTIDSTIQGQYYTKVKGSDYTPVPSAPFGTFAGGTFFGAPGIVVTNMAGSDTNNYVLIDSGGTQRTPPVSVNITVDKVVSGDSVAVFRLTNTLALGGVINKTEYTTAGTGNDAGSGTVTVVGDISQDTPASGWIRLGATGKRYAYTSWSGSVFTLSGTTTEPNNDVAAYVPLIDEAATGTSINSAAMTYDADIPVLVRVRKYGGAGSSIQPFEIESTIGTNGATVSAIRTEDTVVT